MKRVIVTLALLFGALGVTGPSSPVEARVTPSNCSKGFLGSGTGSGGSSYCGFSFSGYKYHKVLVNCESIYTGAVRVIVGPKKEAWQFSTAYCHASEVAIYVNQGFSNG